MNLGKRAAALIAKEGQEEAFKKFLAKPTFYGQAAVEEATFAIGTVEERRQLICEKLSNSATKWIKENQSKIVSIWFALSSTQEQKIQSIWNS